MYGNEDRHEGVARVLSLGLSESQWRALLEVEPEPIAWLRRQIRERLDGAGSADQPDTAHGGNVCASDGIS